MLKRFSVLDSFRGIAAIFIVIHHIRFVGSITELKFIADAQIFVEMFFVLSGFVLTHGYAFKKNFNFRRFFISRTFRIFPLHIVMLVLIILAELVKFIAYKNGINFTNIPFTGAYDINHIIYHVFLLQSWIPYVQDSGFNGPAWSISVEYYMYMIFFVTLLIKLNIRYIVWLIVSLSAFYLLWDSAIHGTYGSVLRGFSSFFLGALVYSVYKYSYRKLININSNYFSILEIIILTSIIIIGSLELENKTILMTGIFTIQIFVFAFEKGIVSNMLKKNFFLYIGKLSYSIYLIHYIILWIVVFIAIVITKIGVTTTMIKGGTRFIDLGSSLYNNLSIFIILLVVVFLSSLSYKYIEVKGQEIGKRFKR